MLLLSIASQSINASETTTHDILLSKLSLYGNMHIFLVIVFSYFMSHCVVFPSVVSCPVVFIFPLPSFYIFPFIKFYTDTFTYYLFRKRKPCIYE